MCIVEQERQLWSLARPDSLLWKRLDLQYCAGRISEIADLWSATAIPPVTVTVAMNLLQHQFEKLEVLCAACRRCPEVTEEELYKMAEEDEGYIELFYEQKGAAEEYLKPADPTPTNPSPANTGSPQMKLEKLSLPGFDGDIVKFTEFWPLFKSRVHDNAGLDDSNKMGYLVAKLSGPALAVVKGLPHTSAGYKTALDLLMKRFGQRAPLINLHLTEMMEFLTLSDDASPETLRTFSDKLHLSVRSLESLGVDLESASVVLSPMLLSRLPPAMRVKWLEDHPACTDDTIDKMEPSVTEVGDLLKFLSIQVQNREMGAGTTQQKQSSKGNKNFVANAGAFNDVDSDFVPTAPKGAAKLPPSTAAAFTVQTTATHACPICCSSKHISHESCSIFAKSSVQRRYLLVKRASLCFTCLSSGHRSINCTSTTKCLICSSNRHHSSLCRKSCSSSSKVSERVSPSSSSSHNMLLCDHGSSAGVYPTVMAWARGRHRDHKVRLLLDSCSNHTFVTPECARRMNFPIIGSSSLTVSHFNNGSVSRSLQICEIPLKSVFGPFNHTISAYIMDVCHPLTSSPVNISALPHLSGLKFADSYESSQPKQVDILIGFDVLYSFLTDKVRRGPAGTPVALDTKFGWALNGPYLLQPINFSREQSQVLHTQTVFFFLP